MSNEFFLISQSPFVNTYGGLALVNNEAGELFLRMQDCFGHDVFGPLTEEQVKAFHVLCKVEEAE
jgi:hypothetical protein